VRVLKATAKSTQAVAKTILTGTMNYIEDEEDQSLKLVLEQPWV